MAAKQYHSTAEEDGSDGGLPAASGSSSSASRALSIDSDLSCMEDGGAWDKESPSTATFPRGGLTARATASNNSSRSTSDARMPTPSERAQLRRSRPDDAGYAAAGARVGSRPFVRRPSDPPAERVDCLLKMFRAQQKFSPAGVTGSSGSKALCHSASPFVAERRGLFVAWKVRGI